MPVSLYARIPGQEIAQQILFASSDAAGPSGADGRAQLSSTIFPGGSFLSETAVTRRLAHIDSGPFNSNLQELLRLENSFAPLTTEQKINLEAAGSKKALFLLTGQQPGLFGGPILWLHKALTCAALAKEWTLRLSRPVIPIFWVAGDDTDLDECNHVELLDGSAEKVQGPMSLAFRDPASPIPMGEREVDPEGMADLLARLGSIWNPATLGILRRCYQTPCTLSGGFLRLAQSQLGKEGVLFVDGYSKNLRALSQPVLHKAAYDWEAFQSCLHNGTAAATAAGIKAQVPLRDGLVHAFALQAGQRHRLYAEKTSAGEQHVYMQTDPSVNLLPNISELSLTHDVFTRPLVADSIFPVLGHVLGPAELRYFAQLSPLFLKTTGDMPLLHPRQSATVVPIKAKDDFKEKGLDISDMIRTGASGLRTYLENRVWREHPAFPAFGAISVEDWLATVRPLHAEHFADLGPLNHLEKSLGMAWKRYRRSLERMAFTKAQKNSETLFCHVRWLGNGLGQDRHLNFPSLYHALGESGLSAFIAAMEPTHPELQVFLFS